MKKFLKYFAITIGVLILVIVIAAVVLSFVINPNDYKGDIRHYVKDKTGRTLTINGDISLSLFPWLGAKVGRSRLSNAPGFPNKPFARIQQINVNVKVLPLVFHGAIKVGTVEIDGLHLNLERNAKGRNNWSDLIPKSQASTPIPAPRPPASQQGGGLAALQVQGLKVKNSVITWTDAEHHRQYRLNNINLTMGRFAPGKTFPLKSEFDLAGTNPNFSGHGAFNAQVKLNLTRKVYTLNDAKATLAARGQAIPNHKINASLALSHAGVNLDSGVARLKNLELKALGLDARANLTGRGLPKQPHFTGTVTLADFSPRKVLDRLGESRFANTSDPAVLQHASGSFALKASKNSLALRNLKMTLDASHVTGVVKVPNIKTQKLVFNLNLDKLDADRYLPKGASKAPPSPVAAAEKPASAKKVKPGTKAQPATTPASSSAKSTRPIDRIRVPVDRIRKLNISGKLHIGTLKAFHITTHNANVTINAHKGVVNVDPLSAKLYGGSYDGNIKVDASGDTPKVATHETVSHVNLGALAKALFKAQRLSGTGNMKAALQGRGKTIGDIRSALNGKLNFALKNGAIQGIDIWAAIRHAYALIKGRPAPASNGPPRTEFAELGGSATVDNGVLHNHDLAAKLPFLRVSGSGSIDLVQSLINYSIKAKVIKTPEFAQGNKLDQLTGITIPLKIGGNLSDMTVQPDLAAALKGEVKHKFEKKLKNKLQDLFHLNHNKHKSHGHSGKPSGHAPVSG